MNTVKKCADCKRLHYSTDKCRVHFGHTAPGWDEVEGSASSSSSSAGKRSNNKAAVPGKKRQIKKKLVIPKHIPIPKFGALSGGDYSKFKKGTIGKSVLLRVGSRELWMSALDELVALCDEVSGRAAVKNGDRFMDSMSKQYMHDRIETDEPVHGYMIRDRRSAGLQGFIILTTFTTWVHKGFFRWGEAPIAKAAESSNSLLDSAQAMLASLLPSAAAAALHRSISGSADDKKETPVSPSGGAAAQLAAELQGHQQFCEGDPLTTGVDWPRVAEVTLLGALRCGGWLLELIMQELTTGRLKGRYDYIVLSATTSAIPFYEKHGFVSVETKARHYKSPDYDAVKKQAEEEEERQKQQSKPKHSFKAAVN